ncbi:NADH-binding protein, partial [Halobacteriales archaeon SW_7_68_16]
MRVLVTGATGFVGSRLVPALVGRGHDVRVLVRDAAGYEPPDGVSVAEGDLLDIGSFEHALDGIDAAYYLVHSMGGSGDFAEQDRRAARHFQRAADEAGIDRAIYLGGLGDDGDRLSEHLRSRREVEHILGRGQYDLTTLRAAIVVGAESAGFEVVRQLAARLPVMVTPRWVRTACQPIWIGDVVEYLAAVLDHPETADETYDIGGPDVLTYEKMLRRTAHLQGKTPLIVPIPVLSPGLSARWLGLMTDVPVGVARPLVEGLRNPVVAE